MTAVEISMGLRPIAGGQDGLSSALDAFTQDLLSRRLSARTIAAYAADLRDWAAFTRARGLREWREADYDLVVAYFGALLERGVGAATADRRRYAMASFHQFLLLRGFSPVDPVAGLPPVRRERRLPDVLSIADVERLIEAPQGEAPPALRDRAMLELAYGAGLRVTELLSVRAEDLDFKALSVRVIGKGNRERFGMFGRTAARALRAWLERGRPALVRDEARALGLVFVNARGGPLTRMGFWKILRGHAVAAGITARVHPHVLRHSFATHLLQGGADLRSVQRLLGHASVASTAVYTRVDLTQLIESYKLHHPRA